MRLKDFRSVFTISIPINLIIFDPTNRLLETSPNRNHFIVDIVVIAIDLKTHSNLNGYLFLGPAQNVIRV